MKDNKQIAKYSKEKALFFEYDATEKGEYEFAQQLNQASKGASNLGQLIENLVEIQKVNDDLKNLAE